MNSRKVVKDAMGELAVLAAQLDSGVSVEHEQSQIVLNRALIHLNKLKKKLELPNFLEHRRTPGNIPAVPFFVENYQIKIK